MLDLLAEDAGEGADLGLAVAGEVVDDAAAHRVVHGGDDVDGDHGG